jgi:hypothetical protein
LVLTLYPSTALPKMPKNTLAGLRATIPPTIAEIPMTTKQAKNTETAVLSNTVSGPRHCGPDE